MARENGRARNGPCEDESRRRVRVRTNDRRNDQDSGDAADRCPVSRLALALGLVVMLALLAAAGEHPAQAATCADYPNQAVAQRAHDTRDADGDGVYCESLPCPCSTAASGPEGGGDKPVAGINSSHCVRPAGVQNISFSATKYPNIRRHFLDALRKGWPRTLVVNRAGAAARRDGCLPPIPPGLAEIATSTRRQWGEGLDRGLSGARTLAAGAPTSGTYRRPRIARTARHLAPSYGASAMGPAFATCSTNPRMPSRRTLRGKPPHTR